MDEGLHVGSEQDRDIRLLSGYFLGYGVVVHSLEGDPSQMTTKGLDRLHVVRVQEDCGEEAPSARSLVCSCVRVIAFEEGADGVIDEVRCGLRARYHPSLSRRKRTEKEEEDDLWFTRKSMDNLAFRRELGGKIHEGNEFIPVL